MISEVASGWYLQHLALRPVPLHFLSPFAFPQAERGVRIMLSFAQGCRLKLRKRWLVLDEAAESTPAQTIFSKAPVAVL